MSNVKRLNLDYWMIIVETDDEFREEGYEPVEYLPKYGRNGRYCLENVEWFEKDGKTYASIKQNCADQFKYELSLLEAPKYSKEDLEEIRKFKMKYGEVSDRVYHLNVNWHQLKEIRRDAERHTQRFFKK